MKNTAFEEFLPAHLPREVQLARLRHVMNAALTPNQREILTAYYLQGRNMPQIARDRGVHKSTVLRTLRRAEDRLRRYLAY